MWIQGLTALDMVALIFFLISWLGFGPFHKWRGRRSANVGSAMIDHRTAWMDALLGRGAQGNCRRAIAGCHSQTRGAKSGLGDGSPVAKGPG
jgi:uncharacterized membrane protein